MAEVSQYTLPYRELTTVLIKHLDIHEGLWSVFFKFGIHGFNLGLNNSSPVPTAIVPIMEIGISRDAEPTPLTVDAADVNPTPRTKSSKRKTKK
jgi:hypothetical protein